MAQSAAWIWTLLSIHCIIGQEHDVTVDRNSCIMLLTQLQVFASTCTDSMLILS